MFSALKKLAKGNDDRCTAPVPMASSLQKKFSKGVHFNMKILIKGDRNVGKSCLLQRLQGGPFIEEYVPTEQIQAAPIHWTYKNSDHIVKVEVWEVVDKGRAKKKPPLGLKLENDSAPSQQEFYETPVLDATFLDVYKNANGVILMMDITKPWTFEYVVKELERVPADIPVVILGNHYDMQHHRQVHPHHIDQAIYQAKSTRTAPVRYAESSMRNGFGLRLLHKFLNIPFLRLQKISLLEQLQRNQRDMEDAEKELDDFQNSAEAHYSSFLDRLAQQRRGGEESRPPVERSPSIVLGAGKPIIPPNVNPLLAQSLNPKGIKAQNYSEPPTDQSGYFSPELGKQKHKVDVEDTPPRGNLDDSVSSAAAGEGALEEFFAGALDASFLDDLAPARTEAHDDSEEETANPMVTVDQDEVEIDYTPRSMITPFKNLKMDENLNEKYTFAKDRRPIDNMLQEMNLSESVEQHDQVLESMQSHYPLWAGDTSARRSPEGGEDPDLEKEAMTDKKHKKKKSKDKDRGDCADKEKKRRKKKSRSEKETKNNPQQGLLIPDDGGTLYGNNYDENDYDSI